jgi:tetratricopeptide (TPR) repeat protein
MKTWLVVALAASLGACNPEKKPDTTPKAAGSGGDVAAPTDPYADNAGSNAGSAAGTPGSPGTPGTPNSGGFDSGPPIVPPNYDPDPAQAKVQVDSHLAIAKNALAAPVPDPDTEAREALKIDAANVDAAAMVAFAYYHKKLYDTAELVLDDVNKRESAKTNANVMYVYGLVYDHTNRPELAVKAYAQAVQINPNFASALVNLGVHQLQNKQYAEAQQTFERLTQQFNRLDAITLTSLGSAYRGRSGDYQAGDTNRDNLIRAAEAAYKRAIQSSPTYGPAYYNMGLLYLDADPFPGVADPIQRVNAAKGYFEQYKNIAGVDMKLYDERMKDVTKLLKRLQKKPPKAKAGAKSGGNP